MNENINLVEILKDCPKGTKLYSTIFGEVRFEKINSECTYPIEVSLKNIGESFTREGKLYNDYDNGECILFPSKDQRDWSKFKYSKSKFDPKTLQPFEKVLARDADDREWIALLFSHINTKGKVIVAGCAWVQVIPYNEDTKHLVGTTDAAHEFYRYWED